MVNKHIKRCSGLLIKTTVKYPFTLIRMAISKKFPKTKNWEIINIGKDVRNWSPSRAPLVGLWNGAVAKENILVVSQEIKNRVTAQSNSSTSGYILQKD